MKKTMMMLTVAALGSMPLLAQAQINLSKLIRQVPAMQVELDAKHAGKYASVFFVAGRDSAVGMQGHALKTRTVLNFKSEGSKTSQTHYVTPISQTGLISVKAASVPKSGVEMASHMVILVHPTARTDMFICSPETGVTPKDARLASGKGCQDLPESQYRADQTLFFPLDDLTKMTADAAGVYTINSVNLFN